MMLTNRARQTSTSCYKRLLTNDLVLVMGHKNAKIGDTNDNYESIMGTHGLGRMNDNGQLFKDFCLETDLVIGESIVPHKTKHKVTWVSPDHTV